MSMKVLTKIEIQGCVCLGVCVCVKEGSFSNAASHSEVQHFPGGGEEEQSRSSLDVVVNGLISSL